MQYIADEILIEPLNSKFVEDITKLYFNYILNTENWNNLYYKFKKLYFESMIDSKYNFVIIGRKSNKLIGFIGLIKDEKEIYFRILRKNIILFLVAIFDLIKERPIRYIKYILDKIIFLLSKKSLTSRNLMIDSSNNGIKSVYRLRPIVVIKEYQGSPLAHNLIKRAEEILIDKKEKNYFLQVLKTNKRAINFYYKVGFKLSRQEGDFLVMEKLLV